MDVNHIIEGSSGKTTLKQNLEFKKIKIALKNFIKHVDNCTSKILFPTIKNKVYYFLQ